MGGRCAVLITGEDRSLVTKLDAANHFTEAHLDEDKNWAAVKSAKCVYSAGFFLTVSVDSMLRVARHCATTNKTYCLNLSAPFLIQFFKDQLKSVLPFADIVFGNETEAATYAEENKLGTTDVGEIAKSIAMLPKENGSKSRLVVITQGSDPVVVVEHGKVLKFEVENWPRAKLSTPTGLGTLLLEDFWPSTSRTNLWMLPSGAVSGLLLILFKDLAAHSEISTFLVDYWSHYHNVCFFFTFLQRFTPNVIF